MNLSKAVRAFLGHWATGISGTLALVAWTAQPAQAAVVVQSGTFDTGAANNVNLPYTAFPRTLNADGFVVSNLTRNLSQGRTLSYQRFDSTLGTLNSVTWQLTNARYSFDILRYAEVIGSPSSLFVDSLSLYASTNGTGRVGGSGLLGTAGQAFDLSDQSIDACEWVAFISLGPPRCDFRAVESETQASESLSADLAAFIGSGTFTEEVQAELSIFDDVVGKPRAGQSFVPFNGAAFVRGNYRFAGNLQLIYDYNPATVQGVPEPGTLWLAAGLLPLVLGWRRRHQGPYSARG